MSGLFNEWVILLQMHSTERLGDKTLLKIMTSEESLKKALSRVKLSYSVKLDEKDAYRKAEYMEREGIHLASYLDEAYPTQLKEIYDPPAILYCKGDEKTLSKRQVSIVGSRKHTSYGAQVSQTLVSSLASSDVIVTSGLALGIDSIVHAACLEYGVKTIAVLGSGVDKPTPTQNANLYNKIIQQGGCIVSEFPLGAPPSKYTYPKRNRIIAGLSQITVVVEAAKKSGSLITARCALEQGRDVCAVPGSIFSNMSSGTNTLIQSGAVPITSSADLLDLLNIDIGFVESKYQDVTDDELYILSFIESQPVTFTELCAKSDKEAQYVLQILTGLEVKSLIQRSGEVIVKVR